MDRLSQLRGEAGGSGDSTLDTTSLPSEAYISANDNSSKYFSLSDSTFDITQIKDVSLASTSADADRTLTDSDELINSNLSPIGKKDKLDGYEIGTQIEAANILSGGVDIFDDNDNSFDGDELVIDDNVESDDKSNAEQAEVDHEDSAEHVEDAAEHVADAAPVEADVEEAEDVAQPELELEPEPDLEPHVEAEANVPNREMEVVLQINGSNVDAIDIGNGLYLYRKDGLDELAAIQILDGDPQHRFKFLKVRDNAEGNLEVYEEIEIAVPKEEPSKDGKPEVNNTPHVPDIDINKPHCSHSNPVENKNKSPEKELVASTSISEKDNEEKEQSPDAKTEVNINGKMMKFSESRKSPVVGSFTPMTFHSTPNKEGKPLTKTMVDLQLHPNRHSDNVKKTIEVHTDDIKQIPTESLVKEKEAVENVKSADIITSDKEKSSKATNKPETKELDPKQVSPEKKGDSKQSVDPNTSEINKKTMNSEINIEKDCKDEKIAIKKLTTSAKCSISTEISNVNVNILDKMKEKVVVEKELIPIVNNASDIAISELDNPSAIPKDKNDAESSTTTNLIKKIETSDKAKVDRINTVAEDSIQNSNEAVDKPVKNINNVAEAPMGVKNITENELKEIGKENSSESKELVKDSGGSKVENTIKSDDDLRVSLEIFSDVSSTSLNIGTEESKAESITLYAIDTDESVSLITPSSTTSTTEKKENLISKISEVLTEISNDRYTPNENITVDKQKVKVHTPTLKKTNVEANNQVDSTSKTTDHASYCKSTEKPNDVEKSNDQGLKNRAEIKRSSLVSEVKVSEKAALSAPLLKVKSSENTSPQSISMPSVIPSGKPKASIPVLKVTKPLEKVEHSMDPGLKLLEKDHKLSEKITPIPVPEIKSLENEAQFDLTPNVKPSEKLGKPITVPGTKSSIKAAQSTPSLETKPIEKPKMLTILLDTKPGKPACTAPVPVVKPPIKAVHSSLSEVKPLEMSYNTKNIIIKPDCNVPVTTIANKPNTKVALPVTSVKSEGIKILDVKVAKSKEEVGKINTARTTQMKIEFEKVTEPISKPNPESKPVNNNHSAAVPFGKWTDANRQEFLNKFKEVRAPVSTNSKQIKNSNDLNRRDVLQKIDSQRAQTIINNATAKAQEKLNTKNETVFSSKVVPAKKDIKVPVKNEVADKKPRQVANKAVTKQEKPQKAAMSSTVTTSSDTAATVATASKAEPVPRDLSTATMASLIEKTIEDMINRVVPGKNGADEPKQAIVINENDSVGTGTLPLPVPTPVQQLSKPIVDDSGTLDDIEMKMNELHGIPFVERPPHELPKVPTTEIKTYSKIDKDKSLNKVAKVPNVITSTSEVNVVEGDVVDNIDSEDEIIEHEPITGDLELNKKSISTKLPAQTKTVSEKSTGSLCKDAKKETIITETDFDKFARRNSKSCENCLTVSFEHKEPHNVVQTVKELDFAPKLNLKPEPILIESKSRIHKQQHSVQAAKGAVAGDSSNNKYHSKIHSAYQSALTAKHQVPRPITIIEDKPVKVVFVESSSGFVPSQLNVQGKELSPAKRSEIEFDATAIKINTESVDPEMLETADENKHHHDKSKTKHQRKQVLTAVETPELELIEPSDIGIEVSPKKKRKAEDVKTDKQLKNLLHKKHYLLGRNTTAEEKTSNAQVKDTPKEIIKQSEDAQDHKDAASAIDNLVKAAELLENQEETLNNSITSNTGQPDSPVKRGRGRPRKYPLLEGASESKTPSPQKKPRLIDAKPMNPESISDEHDDDDSSEDGIIRENWTMGKINENIVCPICNKLFRSENVVFKHVKHCTGVSPNRSESDKRSLRRTRSQESDDKDMDYDIPISEIKKESPKKRKSKESKPEIKPEQINAEVEKSEVIVIEDTPVKEKPEKHDKEKADPEKLTKFKGSNSNLVCEFCGKKFRQLSHLVNHNLQHKKEQTKNVEKDAQDSKLQVFCCEVCQKKFRKLHHLVQHRIIHNLKVPKRTLRKSSSEQNNTKNVKEEIASKQNDDPSAAFRCEPCDKSFRKLHHLVEHRETHDGINRQKPAPAQPPSENHSPPPQICEICKKTFKMLQDLVEHKEHHADTSSEKSDDKSVQSALSTKDIIHECALCYMVFPNEHSLNKHSVYCSKKKRQSKQSIDITESDSIKDEEKSKSEVKNYEDVVEVPKVVAETIIVDDKNVVIIEQDTKNEKAEPEKVEVIELEQPTIVEITQPMDEKVTANEVIKNLFQKDTVVKSTELQSLPAKRDFPKSDSSEVKEMSVVPPKIKKIERKEAKIPDIQKKKSLQKEKAPSIVAKRQKTINAPPPIVDQAKPLESSDDDEVRYMLNPNYKVDETDVGKTFMKVRASKRNSLQIERPTSKDLVKRRTSLQYPPKIPRLKPKPVEPKLKAAEPKPRFLKPKLKAAEPKLKAVGSSKLKAAEPKLKASEPKPKPIETKSEAIVTRTSSGPPTSLNNIPGSSEAALSTDSDDSDVKYSFPKAAPGTLNVSKERTPKGKEKKASKKSLPTKRKSLVGIAKRKSLGTAITAKHKVSDTPPVKKRRSVVEHRCDCGQLFGSAALLSRHTSLAHTPPRIRRCRSPPPPPQPRPAAPSPPKPATRKSSGKPEPKPSATKRKSAVRSEATATEARLSKPNAPEGRISGAKARRSAAFSGIPLPEKMKKMMLKRKK